MYDALCMISIMSGMFYVGRKTVERNLLNKFLNCDHFNACALMLLHVVLGKSSAKIAASSTNSSM